MKKCPYCAEEIQDEAVLCKYCKCRLDKQEVVPQAVGAGSTPPPQTAKLTLSITKKKAIAIIAAFIAVVAVVLILKFKSVAQSTSLAPLLPITPQEVTSTMIPDNLKKVYCSDQGSLKDGGVTHNQCLKMESFGGLMADIDDDGRPEWLIRNDECGCPGDFCYCDFFDDEQANFKSIEGIDGACKFEVLTKVNKAHRNLVVEMIDGDNAGDGESVVSPCLSSCELIWDGTRYQKGNCTKHPC